MNAENKQLLEAVESASGVMVGGRTGLTAVVSAALFALGPVHCEVCVDVIQRR